MKSDAVQQLLEVVCSVARIDAQAVSRVDQAIRQEFGGCALRISSRPPVTIDQIDAGLRQRKSVALIATEAGLSRSTIYRMLGKRTRRLERKSHPDQR